MIPQHVKPDVPLSYFKEHECSLPREKISHRIVCGRFRRWILDQTSVSISDARAQAVFRSYAGFGAENYRQYKHHPLTIHPYSKFRLYFGVILVFALFYWQIMISVHYTTFVDPSQARDDCHFVSVIVDVMYITHIIMSFFTGYVNGDTKKHVVLDLKKVSLHYLMTWFLLDAVTCLKNLQYYIVPNISPRTNMVVSNVRIFRVLRIFSYTKNFLKAYNVGRKLETVLNITLIMTSFVFWNIWFMFTVEVYIENDPQPSAPRNCSWMTLTQMWNETTAFKFVYGLHNAFEFVRGNYYYQLLIRNDSCTKLFTLVSMVVGQFLLVKCVMLYFVIYLAKGSAKLKFLVMTRVLQKYMRNNKLPKKLQKMIMKYYALRFQSHFIVESRLLETVTGPLREDIIMHTRSRLVANNKFINQLPRSLQIQISLKLKSEVFNAGDIIFKANECGNCIYFIDRGVVTAYTASGQEFRHFEDGDYFGERCLLMKNSNLRVATAVAVSNCDLYRLEREDFENSVECYPAVFEKIKKDSVKRHETICLIEDRLLGRSIILEDLAKKATKSRTKNKLN